MVTKCYLPASLNTFIPMVTKAYARELRLHPFRVRKHWGHTLSCRLPMFSLRPNKVQRRVDRVRQRSKRKARKPEIYKRLEKRLLRRTSLVVSNHNLPTNTQQQQEKEVRITRFCSRMSLGTYCQQRSKAKSPTTAHNLSQKS